MRTVQARDADSGKVLLRKVRVAETFPERLMGLMGRKRLGEDEALLLPRCSSIHMLFMRFPIDAVYLDRSGVVKKIVSGLRPWRFSWSPGAESVLEAPAGWAGRAGLAGGDRLILANEATERA